MRLQNSLFKMAILLSSILAVAMIFAITDKNVSQNLRNLLKQEPREVLATVSGSLIGENSHITVVKVKNAEGVAVEIYDTSDNHYRLLSKIELGAKDAYFDFYGRSSNLAVDDVDGDKTPEILVPLYDKNFVAQLAILKYNPQLKSFVRL